MANFSESYRYFVLGAWTVETDRTPNLNRGKPLLKSAAVKSLAILCLYCAAMVARGADNGEPAPDPWALCPMPPMPAPVAPEAPAKGVTDITSDTATLVKQGLSHFSGDVVLRRNNQIINADSLDYDSQSGAIHIPNQSLIYQPDFQLRSDSAAYNADSAEGHFQGAEFRMPPQHARGTAAELWRHGSRETLLKGVQYTTCPPGNADWMLDADSLRLEHQEGMGYAHGVLLKFMHVPLFYTPYLSFPIDNQRRTGILPPTLGSSGRTGFEFELPVYINLAPNYDWTLTPRYMSKRGIQLKNEFRLMTESSELTLNADVLHNDQKTGTSRSYYRLRDATALPADFRATLDYQKVSDIDYFQDLGSSLHNVSRTYLPRHASLTQSGDWYDFSSQVVEYQIIDPDLSPASHPYRKLPALNFDIWQPNYASPLDWQWGNSLVNFQQSDRVSGWRLDSKPVLSLPFRRPGGFVVPSVAFRHTQYQLQQPDGSSLDINRNTPIYSLDTGLVFERDAGNNLIQTLEPRLYYLNVPYRDQSAIPRFDTNQPDFTFAQLFSDNRFSGTDRQGDADQLSVALSSRLLARDDGRELLGLGVGQIRYFADRRVQLRPTDPPETQRKSGLITEVRTQPTDALSAAFTAEYDPYTRKIVRDNLRFQYRPAEKSVYNVGYSFRRGQLEQTDVSLAWPVTDHWRLVGRWYYSTLDKKTLESLAGLEYESCCWILRAVTRKYIYNRDGDTTNSFFLQLELKGLGSVGKHADDLLSDGIKGYGPDPLDE